MMKIARCQACRPQQLPDIEAKAAWQQDAVEVVEFTGDGFAEVQGRTLKREESRRPALFFDDGHFDVVANRCHRLSELRPEVRTFKLRLFALQTIHRAISSDL